METIDRRILNNIQVAFPITARPYHLIGKEAEVTEKEAWQRVRTLRKNGIIRRIGGIFDSRRLGYTSTLCTAEVPNTKVPVVADLTQGIDEITHNYLRDHPKYNMWFTIIASSEQRIESIISDIQAVLGGSRVYSLPAVKVFKVGVIFNLGFEESRDQSRMVQTRARVNVGNSSPPMLTENDIKLIRLLQEDIPYSVTPYYDLADKIGTDARDLCAVIQRFLDQGIMRRMGAILAHRKSGFTSNAMGVWAVPDELVNKVGMKMAEFAEVTHCYQRQTFHDWPYNLFTIVHGNSDSECREIMDKISDATGIKNYTLLFSDKELKKTSMRYFKE